MHIGAGEDGDVGDVFESAEEDFDEPRAVAWLTWAFNWLTALVLAVTVLAQWCFWLVAGIGMWNPWGAILALFVIVPQMLLMFDSKRRESTCAIG